MFSFKKYHGLGNDFVLSALEDEHVAPSAQLLQALCSRHTGVGADGLILVGPLRDEGARMIIYNRDGSRPQMCGNGVRCVVAMMADAGVMRPGESVIILSDAGPRECLLSAGSPGKWEVAVDMGAARIEQELVTTRAGDIELTWLSVNMGNPHAVVFARPELEHIDRIGAALNTSHEAFPEGVNAEFVVWDEQVLDVVVYERGVGRTQACGTGACAAAAAAWHQGMIPAGEPARVRLPGGELKIERRAGRIWMTGPAEYVFTGEKIGQGGLR